MSHKDVQGRRLNLAAALGATVRVLPRLWAGAGGVLLLLALVCLIPMLPSVPDWTRTGQAGIVTVLFVVAVGALARLSIADDIPHARALGLGPLGFQISWPEMRLVGAGLLCLIFLAMIVAVLGLVVLAIFGAAELDVAAIQARDWARVGPPWKLALLAVLGIIALGVPLLLAVRLSLFVPATLGRRQMVSLNSMGIAYGSFWTLLTALILTSLPIIALSVLIGTGAVEATSAAVVWTVGLVGLQLPLTLGFLGAAYRQLEYWAPDAS